jgi:DNA-binding CsgD family transcriptional regulator
MSKFVGWLNQISAIETAPNALDLWAQVKVLGSDFGADSLLVIATEKLHGATVARSLYSDLSELPGLTLAMGLWRDAVFARALGNSSAFALSDVAALRGPFVSLLETMAAGGKALVVPVADPEASGCVVFAGLNLNLTSLARATLIVAAFAALPQAIDLSNWAGTGALKRPNKLTDRETECLRWVSIGKTDGDVSLILGISPRTVRFHITNAKTKLGVSTRIQAVAKVITESYAA